MRVVHTEKTQELLVEIEELQGNDNIYFAGAYAVPGMGLLEQAALSSKKVTDMLKQRDIDTGML